ncbi:MAG: uracil-DNA glycosylase [Pseudomarimonas sp.]
MTGGALTPSASGNDRVRLEASWKARLTDVLTSPKMAALSTFLRQEKVAGKRIYPASSDIFAALEATPFADVKVVILGQDPDHGAGQAHGLCFSVRPGIAAPPSLVNIFNEITRDLGAAAVTGGRPEHGCLLPWASQGVLLLNSVLTVEEGKPGSHANRGWEEFSDAVVQRLVAEREGLVFMLWGAYAQKKGAMIGRQHCVLRSTHPSPLSAHRGFLGCGHFSAANRWLSGRGLAPIDWRLPARADMVGQV